MTNVVCVGGGTGLFTLLSGLRDKDIDLTGIVSMADNGGSSGLLRDQYGILPPGDITLGMLALSTHQDFIRQLLLYRYDGGLFEGHTIRNILFAAAANISSSPEKAIKELCSMFQVKGTIFPVTLDDTHLYAKLADGKIIKGETNIDIRKIASKSPIENVWLYPYAGLYKESAKALAAADAILFGPGDLYTSIIPNVLVDGFKETVQKSNAKKIFVTNIFTKEGETNGFTALRFLSTLEFYLGKNQITDMIMHDNGFSEEILKGYEREGATPVKSSHDMFLDTGVRTYISPMATKVSPVRHDSSMLADVVMQCINN